MASRHGLVVAHPVNAEDIADEQANNRVFHAKHQARLSTHTGKKLIQVQPMVSLVYYLSATTCWHIICISYLLMYEFEHLLFLVR